MDQALFVGDIAPRVLAPDNIEGIFLKRQVKGISQPEGDPTVEHGSSCPPGCLLNHRYRGIDPGNHAPELSGKVPGRSSQGTADVEHTGLLPNPCHRCQFAGCRGATDMDLLSHHHLPKGSDCPRIGVTYIADADVTPVVHDLLPRSSWDLLP